MGQTTLYWTLLQHKQWALYMAATDQGLCYIGSQGATFDELANWSKRHFEGVKWVEDEAACHTSEVMEYLDGQRTTFDLPIDLKGTTFQQQVWKVVQDVPFGEIVSYSDIAQRLGRPSAVRAVGRAIGANPVLFIVPCHRILAKNGSLTGFRGGLPMKEQLLRLEGIVQYSSYM
ncbi:methylated-DNA--[protein]-cysteine S-methyltransferase [Sporosarcina sp. OR05]|uniref:methylated-DNA--[protein]-cysteine S-methyltransferase n=1 Tax=Sporosarcina sp. OR05 TaxID=2969819 RepID=UPI00352AB5F9